MNLAERDAVATVCLLAAFADGRKDEAERAEVRSILENLSGEGDGSSKNVAALSQDVLLGRVDVPRAVASLTRPEHRTLAYEMAVAVCDADGRSSPEERAFLERLRVALALDPAAAAATLSTADQLADLASEPGVGTALAVPPPLPTSGPSSRTTGAALAASEDAELDSMITKYAILNAAIELLPQGLATAAIIPLQMKMVYRVGAGHGFTLSTGHIKDFLATVGVGMTSQVLENYARKFLGGLGKRVLGRMGGAVADQATSSAFSFASTYALGHAAKAYYAGGRSLSAIDLKGIFTTQTQRARTLYDQHRGTIESQSRGLDAGKLLSMVRQGV